MMQFAQSWGQCWTKSMWKSFRKWYIQNSGPIEANDDIPANITSWSDKSWLKYYMKYLIETNRYFYIHKYHYRPIIQMWVLIRIKVTMIIKYHYWKVL